MAKYRERLPQLEGAPFLTDGGLETTLVFHDGVDLPCFAAFPLLSDEGERRRLWNYYARYAVIAEDHGVGFVLEAPTWRANPDWGAKLGLDAAALDAVNRDAIGLMGALRDALETPDMPMVVSGCVGPWGDGYDPGAPIEAEAAQAYHRPQIESFAAAGADMIAAITMTNAPEAIGVALAAREAGMPSAISFTVETDGRLPTGMALDEAIGLVDEATGASPAYYMVNCAHPSHFADALDRGGAPIRRIQGLRANASRLSHAELDAATELDAGDPPLFGQEHAEILKRHDHICVLGGCCGTDHRHVQAIARAWAASRLA